MLTKHQRDVFEAAQMKQAEEAPDPLRPWAATPITSPITPTAMLDRALERGASEAVILDLIERQERWQEMQAQRAFDAALAAAKQEIPVIIKNREVDFPSKEGNKPRTNYRYEDLAEIARTVDPILAKHGITYRFRTTSQPGEPVSVTCIVRHHGGHKEENTLSAGRDESGNKNHIQSIGSAVTYLQRYTLKAALGLAAAPELDDDGAAAGRGERISEAQEQMIRHLVDETGSNIEVFLKTLGVQELSELPLKKFDEAMRKLSVKLAQTKRAS